MEIEIPTFQEFRGSTDGPLHVAFIVHLVSQLLNFINVFNKAAVKPIKCRKCPTETLGKSMGLGNMVIFLSIRTLAMKFFPLYWNFWKKWLILPPICFMLSLERRVLCCNKLKLKL